MAAASKNPFELPLEIDPLAQLLLPPEPKKSMLGPVLIGLGSGLAAAGLVLAGLLIGRLSSQAPMIEIAQAPAPQPPMMAGLLPAPLASPPIEADTPQPLPSPVEAAPIVAEPEAPEVAEPKIEEPKITEPKRIAAPKITEPKEAAKPKKAAAPKIEEPKKVEEPKIAEKEAPVSPAPQAPQPVAQPAEPVAQPAEPVAPTPVASAPQKSGCPPADPVCAMLNPSEEVLPAQLSQPQIKKAMKKLSFEACQVLGRERVEITVTIDSSGKVTRASAEGMLGSCIAKRLRSEGRFPPISAESQTFTVSASAW